MESSNWADVSQPNLLGPETRTLGFDVALISLGINDWTNSVPVATFQANLRALVIADQLVANVILWMPPWPSGGDSTFIPYRQAIYNVADTLGVPLLDVGNLFGTYPNAFEIFSPHPTANGYMAIANAFMAVFDNIAGGGNSPVRSRPWIPMTLLNGATTAGYATPSYRLTADGCHVELIGVVAVTPGDTICQLPVGYRPLTLRETVVWDVVLNTAHHVNIDAAGQVTVDAPSGYPSLDCVTFAIDI
jgi:hypothetical protein